MFFYDPTFILLIPALIFALWAQAKVKGTYRKYSKKPTLRGITGGQAARMVLDSNGLGDVPVERIEGNLTDHYDPRSRKLRLSRGVYESNSVAALGVAAHEAGHALQHQGNYAPLRIRGAVLPAASFGSTLAFPLFFIGFLFGTPFLMDAGILLFTAALLFQVVTLPVEFNASRRAMIILEDNGYVQGTEGQGVKAVLSAASLTYVAAAAMAAMQVIRLLILRGRR